MKTAKIGAIFLVAIMSMTALGAAYAHWEETLTIEGIMDTDDIDVAFYCEDSNDWELDYTMDPLECGEWINREWDPYGEVGRRNKNVGYMNLDVPEDNNNLLKITIGDAYPCYYSHAFWCVRNYGSCPVLINSVKLTQLSFKWTDPLTGEVVDEVWRGLDIPLEAMKKNYVDIGKVGDDWIAKVIPEAAATDPDNYDFFFMPTGQFTIDTQLDPSAWEGYVSQHMENVDDYEPELEQDLCIHFENGCRQLATYDFFIEVTYYNWPEYVGDPPWA
jgi:hypothetical protein